MLALDWMNGNRSALVDADLSGLIMGITLDTKPEEIYRALLEATACGTPPVKERALKRTARKKRSRARQWSTPVEKSLCNSRT
jgi:ribulose kinase